MGKIVKAVNKDSEKRVKTEPFAAIQHDGSYTTAGVVLRMIGVQNLNLDPDEKKLPIDSLVDKLMDDTSNLHVPEILENEKEHLIPQRKLTLHVDSWMVLEVNPDNEWTEVVFYTDQQFKAKYEVVK